MLWFVGMDPWRKKHTVRLEGRLEVAKKMEKGDKKPLLAKRRAHTKI